MVIFPVYFTFPLASSIQMNRKVNLHLICHPAHMLQKLLPATVAAKGGTHKNRKTIANYGRAVSWLPCLPNQHPKTQTQNQTHQEPKKPTPVAMTTSIHKQHSKQWKNGKGNNQKAGNSTEKN